MSPYNSSSYRRRSPDKHDPAPFKSNHASFLEKLPNVSSWPDLAARQKAQTMYTEEGIRCSGCGYISACGSYSRNCGR